MTQLESSFLDLIDYNKGLFFDDVILKKIFSVLYLSGDYVSLDDVASRTSLSLASVSNKANVLAQIGLIDKIRKSGSRKIFLKAKTDFISLMHDGIKKKYVDLKNLQITVDSFLSSQKTKKLSLEEQNQFKNIKLFSKQISQLVTLHKKMVTFLDK